MQDGIVYSAGDDTVCWTTWPSPDSTFESLRERRQAAHTDQGLGPLPPESSKFHPSPVSFPFKEMLMRGYPVLFEECTRAGLPW